MLATLRVVACWILVSLSASLTNAADLPAKRLGRPLRVHIARGLWWQMLGIHEAVGHLGGAELSRSVDVYGSPKGYHGCARAMGTFPHKPDQLAKQDIIILAGSRVATLPSKTQTALTTWVKNGGGLLITGGPLSLDRDKYGPLATILPVEIAKTDELESVSAAVMSAANGRLGKLDWSAKPRVYWRHKGVKKKDGSKTLITAGNRPLLVLGTFGKGKVAVFSGTVCGDPATGETAFWDWPDWPIVISELLRELAPKASIKMAPTSVPRSEIDAARKRFAEISETGLELFDDLLGEEEPTRKRKGKDKDESAGDELAKFAALIRSSDFAKELINAVIESDACLSAAQSETIFEAAAPYLSAETASKLGGQLLKSSALGPLTLGLRLAGLGHKTDAGSTMVKLVTEGFKAKKTSSDSIMGVTGFLPPDGKDDEVRLAAVLSLVDLADPALIRSLKDAHGKWRRGLDRNKELSPIHIDIEETGMAALAAMGDPAAAMWVIDRLIDNEFALEAVIDMTQKPMRNPSPKDIRERNRARADVGRLAQRNRRLREALRILPTAAWPGLTTKSKDWDGEFATEALLLALATRPEKSLSSPAKKALATIRDLTPIGAVRALCIRRLD